MPQVDIPFIIGVIREKEKGLLEDDEYTRIRGAASASEAAHAIADTPYGIHLAGASSPLAAISERIVDEFEWLVEMLGGDHFIITFIAARFDALHIAAALIDTYNQNDSAEHGRAIGTVSADLLANCIRENTGWESVPAAWRSFLQQETAKLSDEDWTKGAVIERTKDQMIRVMQGAAKSVLAKEVLAIIERRLIEEAAIRPNDLPSDLIAFERTWDEELMELLRPWRANATQPDAVLAWWYALQLESKSLRLLLSAKISGFSVETLEQLKRSLYRNWV